MAREKRSKFKIYCVKAQELLLLGCFYASIWTMLLIIKIRGWFDGCFSTQQFDGNREIEELAKNKKLD
jgi:hypothetical protein